MVAIEICTAAFRMDQLTPANMVATALFGDGAAACVVRAGAGEQGLALAEGAGEHMWPDTLDIMGWKVDPTGLGVVFDRSIPPFAEQQVGPAVEGILSRIGVARASVDRFACHPGGAKVITALETTLRLEQGTLDHEREVLRQYGNMSAPTVLFVLERLAQAAGLPKRTVLTALGPGLLAAACRWHALREFAAMSWAALILALVTAQRLGELVLARRNTRRLLADGAHEVGAAHYPLIVVLHAAWLLGLWYLTVYRASAGQGGEPVVGSQSSLRCSWHESG